MHKYNPQKNVSKIIKNNLCINCGACESLCPTNSIELNSKSINKKTCTSCGLCLKLCPSGTIELPEEEKILKSYIGYSLDEKLRWGAASGGITTAILQNCLQNKTIDYAVVADSGDNPTDFGYKIAKTKEEIFNSKGSKYFPVNTCKSIDYIRQHDEKCAVVGLPCHLLAFKKAEKLFPELKEKIVLYLGLFCQTAPRKEGLYNWLAFNKINMDDINSISFRGEGWPGGMKIILKDKKEIFYPLSQYWDFLQMYPQKRCLVCPDALAEYADISIGDAWLREYSGKSIGHNIFVSRTPRGDKIIQNCTNIEFIETSAKKVNQSQFWTLDYKKNGLFLRLLFLKLTGQSVPVLKFKYNKSISLEAVKKLIEMNFASIFYKNEFVWKNYKKFQKMLREKK